MAILTMEQIAGVAAENWPAGQAEIISTAVAIAMAESGGDPQATHKNNNGSIDYGLWQINSVHQGIEQDNWSSPFVNAKWASDISSLGSNWKPWSTYNNGAYLKWMVPARLIVNRHILDGKWELPPDDPNAQNPGQPDNRSDLTKSLDSIVAAFQFLTNPHSYLRMAMFFMGALSIILGVVLMIKGQLVKPVQKFVTEQVVK